MGEVSNDIKSLAYGIVKMVIDERLKDPEWPEIEFGSVDDMDLNGEVKPVVAKWLKSEKAEPALEVISVALRRACEEIAEELRLLEEEKARVMKIRLGRWAPSPLPPTKK